MFPFFNWCHSWSQCFRSLVFTVCFYSLNVTALPLWYETWSVKYNSIDKTTKNTWSLSPLVPKRKRYNIKKQYKLWQSDQFLNVQTGESNLSSCLDKKTFNYPILDHLTGQQLIWWILHYKQKQKRCHIVKYIEQRPYLIN